MPRGIEPDERVTYSNGVRNVTYRDADGNEIGFGGALEIWIRRRLGRRLSAGQAADGA